MFNSMKSAMNAASDAANQQMSAVTEAAAATAAAASAAAGIEKKGAPGGGGKASGGKLEELSKEELLQYTKMLQGKTAVLQKEYKKHATQNKSKCSPPSHINPYP